MAFFKKIQKIEYDEILSKKILRQYNKTRIKKNREYLCHAPFKSMTFFLGGKVMACWHNKQFLLGEFPKNTIQEIWFGERRNKLKNFIKNSDLRLGCFECYKNLESGLFATSGASRYDYLPVSNTDYPVSIDFQICNTCNNECIMCVGEYSSSIRMHREHSPNYENPYDNSFIKQLEPFIPFLKEASFSGGEVFLCESYYEIWKKFAQINPEIIVSVSTNGTVIYDRVKEIINKLKFNINISLDASDKVLFEKIRKNSNFEQILKNLDYFDQYTKEKQTSLIARINVIQQNYDNVPELIQELNKKNIKIHFNQVVFPPYSAIWMLDSYIIEQITEKYKKIKLAQDSLIQKQNTMNLKELIEKLNQWKKLSMDFKKSQDRYNVMTVNELMIILFKKIEENFERNLSFEENEKEILIQKVTDAFESLKIEIEERVLKNAFIFYLSMPINRLIDEFNLRNRDSLKVFTRQAGIYKINI
ncbi:MAG: hypothetical protein Fur0028_00730 [Bacteroidales bacterium]